MFNNEIIKTDLSEREVVLFFRICEINKAKEIRANNPAISTSIILNSTVLEGVLKLTSLSNSEFFGNISGRLKAWSPFDSSSVKLYCTRVSKLW
jgi:hypothetical protein